MYVCLIMFSVFLTIMVYGTISRATRILVLYSCHRLFTSLIFVHYWCIIMINPYTSYWNSSPIKFGKAEHHSCAQCKLRDFKWFRCKPFTAIRPVIVTKNWTEIKKHVGHTLKSIISSTWIFTASCEMLWKILVLFWWTVAACLLVQMAWKSYSAIDK